MTILRPIALALLLFSTTCVFAADDTKPCAARSVHLGYTAPAAVLFYNEVTVEKSTPGSYFMTCGFRHGYFGIQEQGAGQKVVIFSVWDPTQGNNANQVAAEERVEVLYQGDEVRVKRFGGEGTGGQSFFTFPWKTGETYRFCVSAKVDGKKTAYAGYIYLPDTKTWKHLVTFRTRTGGAPLDGLYSFIEDFRRDTKSASEVRRAIFGNGWVRTANGEWTALVKARFTASGATWEAKNTIDAGVAGAAGERFYLQTGGSTTTHNKLHSELLRKEGKAKPPELPKQLLSSAE